MSTFSTTRRHRNETEALRWPLLARPVPWLVLMFSGAGWSLAVVPTESATFSESAAAAGVCGPAWL